MRYSATTYYPMQPCILDAMHILYSRYTRNYLFSMITTVACVLTRRCEKSTFGLLEEERDKMPWWSDWKYKEGETHCRQDILWSKTRYATLWES